MSLARRARSLRQPVLIYAPTIPMILLVEGDWQLRNALCAGLRRAGFDVLATGTGYQALASVACRPFSLVVSAGRLPGLDGRHLWGALRAGEAEQGRPPAPFILLSDAGAAPLPPPDRSLPKPFEAAQLVSAVREMLGAAQPAVPYYLGTR